MNQLSTNMDVLKILPKTNCRDCGLPTCLVFSVNVIQGDKTLNQCPHIEPEVLALYSVASEKRSTLEEDSEKAFKKMLEQFGGLDLAQRAGIIGGEYDGEKISVNMLGKPFHVANDGSLASNCHINMWLTGPLLSYIIQCQGREVENHWMPMRDLPDGVDWAKLFNQRCEKPFKTVVDNYTGMFEYMIDIFEAEPAPGSFSSDIAVVVYPLPKLPMLICYWKPDDGMDSDLTLFFDATASYNLPISDIYLLGVGMLTMFEKIAQTHGA